MPPPKKTTKPAVNPLSSAPITPPAASATPAAAPAPTPTPAPQRSEVKGSGTTAKPAPTRQPTYEQIAVRAYEIYASRGYAAGDPNADWHEAERQLRAGL